MWKISAFFLWVSSWRLCGFPLIRCSLLLSSLLSLNRSFPLLGFGRSDSKYLLPRTVTDGILRDMFIAGVLSPGCSSLCSSLSSTSISNLVVESSLVHEDCEESSSSSFAGPTSSGSSSSWLMVLFLFFFLVRNFPGKGTCHGLVFQHEDFSFQIPIYVGTPFLPLLLEVHRSHRSVLGFDWLSPDSIFHICPLFFVLFSISYSRRRLLSISLMFNSASKLERMFFFPDISWSFVVDVNDGHGPVQLVNEYVTNKQ